VHAKKVMHLDVKPDNILLSHDNVLKIGDFGQAVTEGHFFDGSEGDSQFIAPEVLDGGDDAIDDASNNGGDGCVGDGGDGDAAGVGSIDSVGSSGSGGGGGGGERALRLSRESGFLDGGSSNNGDAASAHLTVAVDIFSFGLLLFQLVTGRQLPQGGSMWHALRKGKSRGVLRRCLGPPAAAATATANAFGGDAAADAAARANTERSAAAAAAASALALEDLIVSMLSQRPKRRPTAGDIVRVCERHVTSSRLPAAIDSVVPVAAAEPAALRLCSADLLSASATAPNTGGGGGFGGGGGGGVPTSSVPIARRMRSNGGGNGGVGGGGQSVMRMMMSSSSPLSLSASSAEAASPSLMAHSPDVGMLVAPVRLRSPSALGDFVTSCRTPRTAYTPTYTSEPVFKTPGTSPSVFQWRLANGN
jgi:serine/threonine protein kinase